MRLNFGAVDGNDFGWDSWQVCGCPVQLRYRNAHSIANGKLLNFDSLPPVIKLTSWRLTRKCCRELVCIFWSVSLLLLVVIAMLAGCWLLLVVLALVGAADVAASDGIALRGGGGGDGDGNGGEWMNSSGEE